MRVSRRDVLAGLGGMAVSATFSSLGAQTERRTAAGPGASPGAGPDAGPVADAGAGPHTTSFPRKADFAIAEGYTYINGAYTHPMPIVAAEAYRTWIDRRWRVGFHPPSPRPDGRADFAALINAKPSEVAWIQNTSSGENLVIEALGLDRPFDGNIVTDELHFEGALVHLLELRRRGADIRIAPQRDGRVDFADLERLVDRKTRLVELSWVSMYNGFQHDLTRVCDLAHAHGAYVYADIIQGVGAIPLDVRATGVDFAASATYKWLMGDFGLAFFYVKEELLDTVFRRPHWSYNSAPDTDLHLSPFDPKYPAAVSYTPGRDAASHVQLGTTALAIGAALSTSLQYIAGLGVERIQAHRLPLLRRLQQEMPRLGFTPQTPADSTSPIVTFAHRDTREVARKLADRRVDVRVAPHWVRIAPSVYNDMGDVERLLDTLS